jgi:predicted RNase H-like HicB family nuclease
MFMRRANGLGLAHITVRGAPRQCRGGRPRCLYEGDRPADAEQLYEHAMHDIEYHFTVRPPSEHDCGGNLVGVPDLRGYMSDGETIEEGIANAGAATRYWIAAMRVAGLPIPPPYVEPVEGYGGKWQLNVPRSLHRRLAERAKPEGVSLNTPRDAAAEGLGQRSAHGG